MAYLSDWLKSVILVILLATFVDLLLPNQSMQRYVKTVVSLFLLMTLLHPLLSLLQHSERVESELASALLSPKATQVSATMESMPVISRRAEAMKQKQQEQTQSLVERQIAELVEKKAEQSAEVDVRRVRVETVLNADEQPVLRSLSLTVAQKQKGKVEKPAEPGRSLAASDHTMKPIQPVAAIEDIRIDAPSTERQPLATRGALSSEEMEQRLTPAMQQTKTQLIHMLAQDWQLAQEHIHITFELETGEVGIR
ncbi:stage III sporulation protein AF [Paenibacillus sp. YYML68]|uniref:stage III sporulation protein AF n=1 Tax=Paenibacillus sp. YYML68 TaxID=2909250 RepID=UPI0024922CF5|nr:stage III sporulation protein AF [Paenibacillus sp. YYML68]